MLGRAQKQIGHEGTADNGGCHKSGKGIVKVLVPFVTSQMVRSMNLSLNIHTVIDRQLQSSV